jgi:Plasmid encoded RepA protein
LAKQLTPARQKLLEAAAAIRIEPDEAEAAFMARHLVQCTLPHSNPGNVQRWLRRSGNLTLVIQPGWDTQKDSSLGYPYGSIPRLLLFWVTTEAVKTKTRRLELGNSLSGFMRSVGLDPNTGGGKRGDAKRLRDQMTRLFRCRISFDQVLSQDGGGTQGKRWLDMQVAPDGEFWWDPKQPEQAALWGSWIELGDKFFQAIMASPVPLDLRALRALKRSPLALDLYAWAAYKVWAVNQKQEPQFIPWNGLMEQLGGDYDPKRIDNFKGKVKATFRKVSAVFPEGLNIQWHRSGLTFLPGKRTAISPRRRTLTPQPA